MDRDRLSDSLVVDLLEQMPDGCIFLDRAWRCLYVNPKAGELAHRAPEELLGKRIWDEFPEIEGLPFRTAAEAALADQQPRTVDSWYAPLDRWFEVRILPSPDGVVMLTADVTPRKARELAARNQAIAQDRAESMAQLGLWTWRPDTEQVFWSSQLYRIYGEDPDTFRPTLASYLDHVHPEDLERVRRTLRQALETDTEVTFEHRAIQPSGDVRRLRCWGRATRDVHGVPEMFGTCLDLTDTFDTLDALHRTEEWLNRTLEACRLGVWERDVATGHMEWSLGFERIFALAPGEFDGTVAGYLQLVHPEDRQRVADALRDVQGRHDFALVHRTAPVEGATRWVSLRGRVSRDDDGDPVRMSGSIADVTAKRLAEEQAARSEERIRHLERMAMLGRLAAGVAHDFNNLLTVVRTSGEILDLDRPGNPLVHHVLDATDRAAALTRKLLELARGSRAPVTEFDLNAMLRSVEPVLRSTLPGNATLLYDLDAEPIHVFGDREQLERVVMNLVLNARDAMPSGGVVTVRTRQASQAAVLEVNDTGHGMPAEVLEHVFEPFFTTKPGGTGLGLANVREIVAQHRGDIVAESVPGGGSTFRVELPRAASR